MNLPAASNFNYQRKVSAFTLMEVMLVVALTLIISVLVAPVGFSFYKAQLLNETTDGVTSVLRQAQSLAMSGKNNSSFGIFRNDEEYVFFMGDTYETRNIDEDEVYRVPSTVILTGPDEIVFSRVTGEPSTFGVFTISLGSKERQVEVLESGNINR